MFLELAFAAALPISFHYDADEWSNAAYNIVCLAEQIPCSKPLYEALWKDDLKWTDDDARHLDAWKSVVTRMAEALPPSGTAPLLPNYMTYHPQLKLRMSVAAAALASHSPDEFGRRIAPLVNAEDAETMRNTLVHYQRRLQPWWESTGAKLVEGHIRDVQAAMSDEDVTVSTRAAVFLNSQLASPDVYVHAVPSPSKGEKIASATVFENHFVVEITATDKASDTIWKALHELTHAYFDAAPEATHQAIMKQFVDEPGGAPFYTYFNEALATAVQRMVIEQSARRTQQGADGASAPKAGAAEEDDGGYRHPYIPRLARALEPVLRHALAGGSIVTDGFVADYIRAGRAELGSEATSPRFVFGSVALFANEPRYAAREAARNAFNVWFSVGSIESWRRFGETSAIFINDYDEVKGFSEQIPDLEARMKHRGFAYVTPYRTQSRVLVLAGRDNITLLELIERVAALPSVPAEGVFLTID